MFTRQVPDLIRRLQGQMPEPAISAIEDILGNCDASLEHRGPVSVEIDGNYMPGLGPQPRGGPLGESPVGDATSAVLAVNRAGEFVGKPCKSDVVKNGLALRAIGPSHLDSARIDELYIGSLSDLCGNPLDLVGGGAELSRFIVTNESPAGGGGDKAIGKLITWDGAAYVQTGNDIALIDYTVQSEFSNRWRSGYYGWASRQSDRLNVDIGGTVYEAHEVVWVESKTRFIEFSLTADVAGQSAPADVLFAWGADDRADVPTSVTIVDRPNHMPSAKTGFRGIAVWDEIARAYIPLNTLGSLDPDAGNPAPQLDCIQITVGTADATCLYQGKVADYGPIGTPDFCEGDVWVYGANVWVFAPNAKEFIKQGNLYFGMLIDPAFDNNGDIRPMYVIKEAADLDIVLLRFDNAARGDDCTYQATVVSMPGPDGNESYCNPDEEEVETDVFVYLPNSNALCPLISGTRYGWGMLLVNDYRNGKPLYMSKLEVLNCRSLFAVVELVGSLDCSASEGQATYVEFMEHGEHKEPWDTIGEEFTFDNKFGLCGDDKRKGLVMLSDNVLKKHLLIQVEHVCATVVTDIIPNDDCTMSVTTWKTSLMVVGDETVSPLNLEDTICNCDCP